MEAQARHAPRRVSDVSFTRYGKWAEIDDPLFATGRPPQTRTRERLILADVAKKLELKPEDRVLDIGSGIGTLTIPMSFMVSRVTAVDHPACVARLKKRAPHENIDIIEGGFLAAEITQSFTKILAYSVVHYLASMDEVVKFIDKALRRLERHGLMLIGDIPNSDLKDRFEKTPEGQAIAHKWNEDFQKLATVANIKDFSDLEPFDRQATVRDPQLPDFGDSEVIALVGGIRTAGFDAWLLPQPHELPMGSWREDLLIVRP